MKSHYRAVVIGGGVVGASVLYHLAKFGWTDVCLIERSVLTAGSSWHAAGGFHALNADPNIASLQAYTIDLLSEIEQESGQSVGMNTASPQAECPEPGPMSREWHWHPDLPVNHAPYWHWPPKPRRLAKWLWQNWLQVSDRSIYLALAFAVAFWLQPVTAAQSGFAFGWTSMVFLRNWGLLLIVAGGLHLWFYGIDGQGKLLKYDPRPYMIPARTEM